MDLPDPSGHRWALPQLRPPPTLHQLQAARRVGLDVDAIVERWKDDYAEAERQDEDRIFAAARGDELLELLDRYSALSQKLGLSKASADLEAQAARIVNPDVTCYQLREARLAVLNGACVREQIRKVARLPRPRRAITAPATAPRPRQRRTAASSSTSSADPPPGEQPRWVTLWKHPDIGGGS